jgi:site-specific recombinase XerD
MYNNDFEISAAYFNDLQSSSLADQTKRAYASRIKAFMRFVEHCDGSKEKSLMDHCASFLFHLKENEQLKATSVNAYRTSLLHCINYSGIEQRGLPERLEMEPQTRESLTREHFEKYVMYASTSRRRRIRDTLIVYLVALDGLGPKKCVELTAQNLLIRDDQVRLVGAGMKEQRLSKLTARALFQYRPELFTSGVSSQCPVLLNRNGRGLSCQTIDYVVRSVGWRCGLVVCARTLHHSADMRMSVHDHVLSLLENDDV